MGKLDFEKHLATGHMRSFRAARRVFASLPEMAAIMDREAGVVILLSVLLRDAAGEVISIAALARQFQVSRAHIRSILQVAEALGMVTHSGPAGVYRLEPPFMHHISRVMAVMFQVQIYAIEWGLAHYDAASPPPSP